MYLLPISKGHAPIGKGHISARVFPRCNRKPVKIDSRGASGAVSSDDCQIPANWQAGERTHLPSSARKCVLDDLREDQLHPAVLFVKDAANDLFILQRCTVIPAE